MKYFKLFTIISLVGSMISTSALAVPQNRWAYQTSTGIPNLYTPLFAPYYDVGVGSSWNEPRGSNTGATGPHTGVDQSVGTGSDVGSMYSPARILRNELSATGAQVIRYYNSATNKTFYSVYFHLSAYVMAENTTPLVSDVTAKSGKTGTVAEHLHFELLDYIDATVGSANYGSRIGVNPRNYILYGPSSSTINKFDVFKNVSLSGRTLSIDAVDTNLNVNDPLEYVKIYYKTNGGTTWSSANMTKVTGSTYRYQYTFPTTATYVDYFVAGRRKSSGERWSLYPASVYDTGESSSGLTPTTYPYETIRIYF